jgi:Tfp pilus assembly protein PilN
VSTQTVQTAGVAVSPRVNLMPPEIEEAQRFRRLQLAMGGAVVLSAVVVGLLYQHAKSGISSAQSQVTAAQQQHDSLQGKLASLSNVSQTYQAVQAKQELLQQAMGQEIRWSYMLNDLTFRIPSNVWLTSIQATETAADPAAAASAATTLGAAPTNVGTIAFSGVAFKHDDVATWLDSLAKERGFTDPSFSNSTEDVIGTRPVVRFGSSADLSANALSNRYANKAGN